MKKLLQVPVHSGLALFAIALTLLAGPIIVRSRILSWIVPVHDESRIAAEKALAEGEQLWQEWKVEARRRAIKKYEEALAYWKAAGKRQEEAATFRKIGKVYHSLGEQQKALNHYNRALLLYREANDLQGEGETLNNIGYVHLYSGKTQEALEFCSKALYLSRDIGNRWGEADALDKVGEIHYFFGDIQKSLDYYHQALPIWLALNDRRGQAQTLTLLGHTYSDLSERQKALDSFTRALSLWHTLNDYQGQVITLIALGRVNILMEERQQALSLFNQAVQLIQPMGDRDLEARAFDGIGYIYAELGDRQRALEYYKQALKLFQSVSLRKGEAGQLIMIGEIHFSLGNKQEAIDYYQQALSIVRVLADQRLESPVLRYIGLVYDSWGDKTKALTYYNQALLLSRAGGDRRQEACILNSSGQIYASIGKRQRALGYYNQALTLNQATGDRFGESLTLYNIALAERGRGNLIAARSRIEDSLRIAESLRTKVASHDLRASYFASIHQRYEFYIDLLIRLHKRNPTKGFAVAALEANERAHARSTLELLTESRANIRQGINAELLERERSLQQLLNDKADRQARLVSGKHTEAEAATISKEIQELTTKYDQVKAQIRAESPRYAALTQPQPASLREVQQLLEDNTLLLEYALGSERSYLWAVTRTGLRSYELPRRAEIEKLARPVYDLLSRPQLTSVQTERQREAAYWRQAAALSRLLLKPVAGQLGSQRLLIVADGILQYIPFAALPKPSATKSNGKRARAGQATSAPPPIPLIVEHEIVNLPSASTLAVLRRETAQRRPAPKTVAVLADPVFEKDDMRLLAATGKIASAPPHQAAINQPPRLRSGSLTGAGLPRLWATWHEARAIEEITTAAERLVAEGFAASRAQATDAELSQYRIIHFATHGVLDSEYPELSAIVLSLLDQKGNPQDGYLRLHDIYNLNLPAELVVLSACSTGLGKEIKGEGLIGLTRGFMYAGAARVMASLWRVEDAATAKLMGHFYRHMLKEGLPPAAALRRAQVALWQDTPLRAPYYWAAFVIQGEWR